MAIFPHIYLRVILVDNYRLKAILRFSGVAAFMAAFFFNPQRMIDGAGKGLNICTTVIIPSLFPFMVVSDFVIRSGLAEVMSRLLDPITRFLFRIPGSAGCAVIMSMLGGYPVGAKMTAQLLESGSISRNQAKRMMLFCINAGPAFVIGTVGTVIFSSRRAGVILFSSMILASLMIGVFSRFFDEDAIALKAKTPEIKSGILPTSVMQGVRSMVFLCAWVMLFCCVGSFAESLPYDIYGRLALISEVTGGCISASLKYPVSIQALIMGWGGLCVHCQLIPYLRETQTKYLHFALSRIVHGALSATVADFLLKVFPCETDVFSTGTQVLPKLYSVSVPAAVSTVILAVMLVAELSAFLKKKNNAGG